jgi:hypothetical protein
MHTDHPLLIAPAYETGNDKSQLTLCAPVLDLGRPARDKLASNRRWKAIACFRRSMYLRAGNGDIICLCSPLIDRGPLNVRCALPEATDWRCLDLGAERTAVVEGESLRFGSKTIFYSGRARIWEPAHVDNLGGATLARLEAVLDAAAGSAPDMGLGPVFRPARSQFALGRGRAANGVLGAAAPALRALAQWLKNTRFRQRLRLLRPPCEAIELIGLGPGLTPSGDDYLGGLMIGLRALKRGDLATCIARLVLPEARKRTGIISHAHLACAAKGYGGEALHRTIAAIAGSGPLDSRSCLDAVGRMGATSGWDALAGAVMPFRIVLGARMPATAFGG